MKAFIIIAIASNILGVLLNIAMIGEPRSPISKLNAIIIAIVASVYVYFYIQIYQVL